MSLSREDVLRELELLPVWKLRDPAKVVESAIIDTPEKPASTPQTQYEITISQDKQWAFVCEISMPASFMDIGSQSMLFNNILHALNIEKPSKMQVTNIAEVQVCVLVALGEQVAQVLLNTQESLENLRGKLHAIGGTQLLVTHDLAHLLKHPLDKAKVWQDLCLARSYLQSLPRQD